MYRLHGISSDGILFFIPCISNGIVLHVNNCNQGVVPFGCAPMLLALLCYSIGTIAELLLGLASQHCSQIHLTLSYDLSGQFKPPLFSALSNNSIRTDNNLRNFKINFYIILWFNVYEIQQYLLTQYTKVNFKTTGLCPARFKM